MSNAAETFAHSILDAEYLLSHFNRLNNKPPQPDLEVLKRAGLIMAMTAWETYVEDRVAEAATARLSGLPDESIALLVQSKLSEELARLHSPTAETTIRLFREYAAVNLADVWLWNNYDYEKVRKRLNEYIKLRGNVVHRSLAVTAGPPKAHPVTKQELEKAIGFLKALVQVTESAFPARD